MKTYQNLVPISFNLNGKKVSMDVEPDETALFTIRRRLGLKGTKEGCGIGECGACTIIVDGMAINACLMLAPQLDNARVVTVEGLENPSGLNSIQEAFLEHHAVQCGFCTPGILMSTQALLDKNPHPDREEIVKEISGNLCRCTGYKHIVNAIEHAAGSSPNDKNKA